MITERADVGKGTFYQHFSSKEVLIAHLVDGAVDRLTSRISKGLQGVTGLRPAIEAIVNAHLDHFQQNREEFILFFQGHGVVNLLGTPPEDLESSYLRYLERLEGFIGERLPAEPGIVPLRRVACAIAGFAVGYLSFAILGLSEENLRQTYRPVRESLVNGLTALVEKALAASVDRVPPAVSDRAGVPPAERPSPAEPEVPPAGPSPMTTPP